MSYPVMPLGFLGSQGDQDTYRIERSLRFNSADSAYLSRTPSSTTNRKTWTYSTWIKRSKLSSASTIFFGWNGSNTSTVFQFTSTDNLELYNYAGAYYAPRLITNQVLRDVSAWYHIVLVWDADNAISSDRQRIYINGVRITSFSTESYSNDIAYGINVASYPHGIGGGAGSNFDGYMAEINFIDGQALTPSSFGETDAITGRWKAKAYSGTYGTNGFYLSFKDNTSTTTLGYDDAGSNDWTLNNFSVTAGAGNDSLVDSPTNYGTDTGVGGEVRGNYATHNPIDNSGGATLSNGNLDVAISGLKSTRSTIAMRSGKWYCECLVNTVGNTMVGLLNSSASLSQHIGSNANSWGYYHNGQKYLNNSATNYGNTYTNADIIGIAYNADSGKLWFSKNGTWQASGDPVAGTNEAYSSISGDIYFGTSNSGSISSNNTSFNFGQRPFAYTAPTGFKALCTTNLPTPTIRKPSSAMDVVTYTGNGSARSITGLGFSPDLVWIKGRSGATDHAIYDSVRGVQLDLAFNLTSAETTQSQGVTAFNSDGFSIGTLAKLNTNTSTYVAWAWDEAPIAGMDIVSFTAPSTNQSYTVSHSLGVAPKMTIVKRRDSTGGWWVWHSGLGDNTTDYLELHTTAAKQTATSMWGTIGRNSSSIGLNSPASTVASANYIAYLFAEVEGFSKFGSYTGNGSADGPFVFTGHRPRWLMIKRTDVANDWQIWDTQRNTFNTSTQTLAANLSDVEYTRTTTDIVDFNSNGFKVRASNAAVNASGGTYIFAAFAESPFKYARAR